MPALPNVIADRPDVQQNFDAFANPVAVKATLVNSWAAVAGETPPTYLALGSVVIVYGSASAAAATNGVAFILPVGFRPAVQVRVPCTRLLAGSWADATAKVDTAGNVSLLSSTEVLSAETNFNFLMIFKAAT